MPTEMIQLSPAFLQQLKGIAPKKRRSKVWWVVLAAILGVGVWMAVSSSSRAFVVDKSHALVAHFKKQPAPQPTQQTVQEQAPVVDTTPAPPVTTAAPQPTTTPADVMAALGNNTTPTKTATATPAPTTTTKPKSRTKRH